MPAVLPRHAAPSPLQRGSPSAALDRYEGNAGELGRESHIHPFKAPAPALLGFDERIDAYCSHETGKAGHAEACVNKNL
jgi:hypothetical protein